MGVTFTGMTPHDFEQLRQFAPPTREPGRPAKPKTSYTAHQVELPAEPPPAPAEPKFELAALDVPESAIALEAVVRLLLREEILPRAEIFEEMKASQSWNPRLPPRI